MSWRVGRKLGTTIYYDGDGAEAEPTAWVPGHPDTAARIVSLLNVEGEIREMAKYVIAYSKAIGVYFPDLAGEFSVRARRVLLSMGMRYWLSPAGDSITCVECALTSHNPKDIEQRYCGNCHQFLEPGNKADIAETLKVLRGVSE